MKGLTQAALARRIGRSQAFIALLEQGRTKHPTYADVTALARALGVEPSALTFTRRRRVRPATAAA